MPHFNQPFSNPLAVGIPVIIDGQIDEIRYRLTPALKALILKFFQSALSAAQRRTVELEQSLCFLQFLVCDIGCYIEPFQIVFKFAHESVLSLR